MCVCIYICIYLCFFVDLFMPAAKMLLAIMIAAHSGKTWKKISQRRTKYLKLRARSDNYFRLMFSALLPICDAFGMVLWHRECLIFAGQGVLSHQEDVASAHVVCAPYNLFSLRVPTCSLHPKASVPSNAVPFRSCLQVSQPETKSKLNYIGRSRYVP